MSKHNGIEQDQMTGAGAYEFSPGSAVEINRACDAFWARRGTVDPASRWRPLFGSRAVAPAEPASVQPVAETPPVAASPDPAPAVLSDAPFLRGRAAKVPRLVEIGTRIRAAMQQRDLSVFGLAYELRRKSVVGVRNTIYGYPCRDAMRAVICAHLGLDNEGFPLPPAVPAVPAAEPEPLTTARPPASPEDIVSIDPPDLPAAVAALKVALLDYVFAKACSQKRVRTPEAAEKAAENILNRLNLPREIHP